MFFITHPDCTGGQPSVRLSAFLFPEYFSETQGNISLILHTHHLEGVDVPLGVMTFALHILPKIA